jgi:hypothetical protein
MAQCDHFTGQTGFAHLNLIEHAEWARDARPDDWAADPGQRTDAGRRAGAG